MTFPAKEEIEQVMSDFEDDHYINIFGDGSVKTPTKWWAALAGHGVWVPDWNKPDENKEERREAAMIGPGLGQTSSSTRQELAAWLRALTIPVKQCYATDSASMMTKAIQLMEAAARYEDQLNTGTLSKWPENPFRKPWGLQTDGDLWEQAWIAVVKRGKGNQQVRKVKGHATKEQVEEGVVKKEDKEGNDASDKLADQGVHSIHGVGLVKLASWIAQRHQRYGTFMKRIRKFIAGMTLIEKAEREKDKKGQ